MNIGSLSVRFSLFVVLEVCCTRSGLLVYRRELTGRMGVELFLYVIKDELKGVETV